MAIHVKLHSVFALFFGMCFFQPSACLEGRIQRLESITTLPAFNTAPCPIDFPNVTLSNTIAYRDRDVYSFNTTFVWGERKADDVSYEVGFVRIRKYPPPQVGYQNCRPLRCFSMTTFSSSLCNVSWQNTSTNRISLEASYSFEYYLFIRPWNRTSGIYWNAIYLALFPYEDCYEATNNRTFCRKLDVDVVSHVVNLSVDVTLGENRKIIAYVTWLEPVQLSFDIDSNSLYTFAVKVVSKNGCSGNHPEVIGIPYAGPNPDIVYNASIPLPALGEEEEYCTYTLQVTPLFYGDKAIAEHLAIIEFNVTKADMLFKKSSTTMAPTVYRRASEVPPNPSNFIILLAVLILSVVSVVCFFLLVKRCFQSPRLPTFIPADDEVMIQGCLKVFAEKELYDLSRVKYVEDCPLGRGQYGSVYKGEVFNVSNSKDWTVAAVKVAKENEIGWKEDFLDEIKLILELGPHPNIIEILGCCTLSDPPLLITEYMKYGDLLHFLHKCRKAETEKDSIYTLMEADLIFIALQVARGMKFMSASKFYHGDLAARNVLITDGLVAKIADFGLSDALNERGYKRMAHGRRRPMRWVSLETLQCDYCSHYSDVWSYGVLLYEIFTFGATPYHDIPIHELPLHLFQGYRLPRPCICPLEIYRTMLQCWLVTPSDRPSFSELTTVLECYQQMVQTSEGDCVGTSADSFVSNPDLRSAVFQPFLEEDEVPSLPIATTVLRDSDCTGGSGSMIGSDSVVDSGFVVDSRSGSIDTMYTDTIGEKSPVVQCDDTESSVKELGVDNSAFHDMKCTRGSEMKDTGGSDDDDDTNVVSETNDEGNSDMEESDSNEETCFSLDEDDDRIVKS